MSGDAKEHVREIASPDEDYARWYVDTVLKAELADYGPVHGSMVIRPYGFALWENVQAGLDRRFKATGHENAYFPMFIPESFLLREAEHVEGFAPEVAWVTEGGSERLTERLAVRPTSEAIIGPMYAKWVQSYRDLPLLINQWANVVRWEKATRLFLRTMEFLWQEGHTAHATQEEAEEETLRMLEVYREFLATDLAMYAVGGQKTESERFAGAVATYSMEALMGDNRALQAATSHYFGTNFAAAYNIRFLDRDGELKFAYTTSWGMSTRIIGAIIMVHGDERGLILPPRVAPIQVVIVPIVGAGEAEAVLARVRQIEDELKGRVRVRLDARPEYTPGWKFNEWELRGVPLRVEVGPRDLKAGTAVLVRRDTREKVAVPQAELADRVPALLDDIQAELYRRSRQRHLDHTHRVERLEELTAVISERRGIVAGGWCGSAACEALVKEQSGATIRNIPFASEPVERCLVCGEPARHFVIWARAY